VTRRVRSDKLVITLHSTVMDSLKTRGARSDRARGPYNYTQQVTRAIELYSNAVVRSDPRETRSLPEAQYDLILDALRNPEELEAFHIHQLGAYLLRLPEFAGRARALGVDAAQLSQTINGWSFSEKLHLVDSAQIRNAPDKLVSPPGEPSSARKGPSRRPRRVSQSQRQLPRRSR
jgi:hypothetical protein